MDIDIILQSLGQVHFIAPSLGVVFAFVLTLVLILLSGLASGSEIAFFSLSPNELSELSPEHSADDAVIKELREDSERTLATILIVNNLVNVTIVMLCNYIFTHIVDFGGVVWLEILCVTVLLTFILLLFGEILPKVYSRQNPLAFCRRICGTVMACRRIFWPLESILMSTGFLAAKVVQKDNYVLSVNELEQALELTDKEDIREEERILQGIVRFGDEMAKEVMTSRQDIVDLEIQSSYADVLKCVIENNYSRIPVYQGSEDNIRGVLYIKDLLPHLSKPSTFRWQSLIRPPYFVPETKKIDDLLRDFQKNKVHIAIVVDEFGGTSGIVTLEDILEEIVGEINDEFDDEQRSYVKVGSNSYVFEGKTLITDLVKILDVDDEEFDEACGDNGTIAGMLLELKGDFPVLHEKLEYKRYSFEVLQLEGRRISKVKLTITPDA
ncbi:MAG: gliding motility-associated protein GldE [Bacteroidales bacterium]|nr:gliding motility-associated protein GldE [Bacteroidales bacterium]MCM1147395.1 gliding motility-associated protein GldE [Bacteroidales bacterium]MCM1206066.1 gliding motility-associated protein GldE [Bacillota bacterium]MCM1510103.1 gliding motility-associated protein GldE [Clostridium sp.]